MMKRFGYKWCCWRGLNSRPPPYQGGALPLSYNSLGGRPPALMPSILLQIKWCGQELRKRL
jgi:hypothetical protein